MISYPVIWAVLALLLPSTAWAQGRAIHHDLTVVLDPAAARLEGTDVITSPAGVPELLLNPGAEIREVTAGGRPVPFRFDGGRLTVREKVSGPLTVRYGARFADPVPEAPLNTEDPSYGVAAAITPRGTFLGGGAAWYPDTREGTATFRVRVEAPAGTSAVTSGKRLEIRTEGGRTSSVWEIREPVQGLALAAGPYRVEESAAGKVPVYTYFYPGSETFADTYRKAAARYLDLYRGLFGPYPFPKFAVAENFFPTGYGYPSWTLLGSAVVRLPFIVETSLGHEVAHSWWGNGVWVDYSKGNWSEGLTTYVADYLYKERESPEEAREYRLKILRDYAALVQPGREIALKDFLSRTTAAEQAVGYGKAAMVFHMARSRIGEEPFWRGLRDVAEDKMFRKASWDDFARALGESGETDLGGFFRQWVERPGAPVLSLEGVRRERSADGWTVRGTVRQRSPVYDLRLPLRLETAGKPVTAVLHSRGEAAPFVLRSADEPRRLSVDPDAHVFRRLDPTEIPPTVNGIRGSEALLVIVSRDLPAGTAEAARTLLAAMGKEDVPLRPEGQVSRKDLRGRDVLFLGLPAEASLLPPLPAGLKAGEKESVLNGRTYAGAGAALFAALPHPLDRGRTAALFLPGSPEAARQAGRKIPHYGKYSYLAFIDGANVDKGIWPVTASPLMRAFGQDDPPTRRKR